jgi:hypothetical protein
MLHKEKCKWNCLLPSWLKQLVIIAVLTINACSKEVNIVPKVNPKPNSNLQNQM